MKPVFLGGFACVVALLISGAAVPAPVPPPPKVTPEIELARLTGRWKVVSRQQAGVEVVAAQAGVPESILSFSKTGGFAFEPAEDEMGKIVRIEPTKNPKEIDYLFTRGAYKDKTQKGFYKLEGDTFTDCCTKPGQDRPTEFKSTKENGYEIMVITRVKKDD